MEPALYIPGILAAFLVAYIIYAYLGKSPRKSKVDEESEFYSVVENYESNEGTFGGAEEYDEVTYNRRTGEETSRHHVTKKTYDSR